MPTLYYVHDPMCSWCWGFRPVWQEVQEALKGSIKIEYVLGGLAVDSELPMPADMQETISNTWKRIQRDIPGIEFNFNFWTKCEPRRSTYPSCRAVIAAGLQGEKYSILMLTAIQQAYYLQAKNPSDSTVLVSLSKDLSLDTERFEKDLLSDNCNHLLNQQLQLAAQLGVNSFPSLVLSCNESNTMIHIDYNKSETIISSILALN